MGPNPRKLFVTPFVPGGQALLSKLSSLNTTLGRYWAVLGHEHTFSLINPKTWSNHLLLSYYLANKQSLHVRFEGLEIFTLIKEK